MTITHGGAVLRRALLSRPGRDAAHRRRLGVAGLRTALVLAGILMVVLVWLVVGPTIPDGFGFDSRAYWGFPRDPVYPGPGTMNGYGIYRYSPAFLPLRTAWSALPWTVFAAAWLGVLVGAYAWLTGRQWMFLLAFPPVVFELYMGNIHLLLAVAIVLGFRWPGAWAVVLLSKVTPGVGLLWFAVRREWRSLGIALGVTGVIAGAGFVLAPDLWLEWLRTMAATSASVGPNHVALPLSVRLAAAAVLVTWGARTDRRWTVIVAAMLGLPTLWTHGFAMLVGIVALSRMSGAPAASGGRVGVRASESA